VQSFGFWLSRAASLLEVIVVALLLLEVLLASRTRQQLGPAGSDLEIISDILACNVEIPCLNIKFALQCLQCNICNAMGYLLGGCNGIGCFSMPNIR
jgi:hypothetical protein